MKKILLIFAIPFLLVLFAGTIPSFNAPELNDTFYVSGTYEGKTRYLSYDTLLQTISDSLATIGGGGLQAGDVQAIRNNDNTITVDSKTLDIRAQGTANHIPFFDPIDANGRLGSESNLQYDRFANALECTNFRTTISSSRQYFLNGSGLRIESSNAGEIIDWFRYENTITGGLQGGIGYRRFSGGDRIFFAADVSGGTLSSGYQMALIESELEMQVRINMGSEKIVGLADGTLNSDAVNLGQLNTAAGVHAATTATTDVSGDLTVTHSLGVAPSAIQITVEGTTFYHAQYHTLTTTNFKVRITDALGAPQGSTAVTLSYLLKE